MGNGGTPYTLTFLIVAEDVEQTINELDKMTFNEKLNYLTQLSNEQEREK
ncbi:MAG TPA: hypothetical protein QF851_01710 [Flavobacteriales bacterium]|nr:hypothetical protein [Flavobacteriales bacterium]